MPFNKHNDSRAVIPGYRCKLLKDIVKLANSFRAKMLQNAIHYTNAHFFPCPIRLKEIEIFNDCTGNILFVKIMYFSFGMPVKIPQRARACYFALHPITFIIVFVFYLNI